MAGGGRRVAGLVLCYVVFRGFGSAGFSPRRTDSTGVAFGPLQTHIST